MEAAKRTGHEQQVEDLEVEHEDAEHVTGGNKQHGNIKTQQQVRTAQAALEEFK
jgi:hypothetical protein